VDTTPGSYATLTRSWTSGDTVTVRLPMRVIMKAANDNPNVSAITYGPVVLSGNYGNTSLSALPALPSPLLDVLQEFPHGGQPLFVLLDLR
jgi:DUF1680 family protein